MGRRRTSLRPAAGKKSLVWGNSARFSSAFPYEYAETFAFKDNAELYSGIGRTGMFEPRRATTTISKSVPCAGTPVNGDSGSVYFWRDLASRGWNGPGPRPFPKFRNLLGARGGERNRLRQRLQEQLSSHRLLLGIRCI